VKLLIRAHARTHRQTRARVDMNTHYECSRRVKHVFPYVYLVVCYKVTLQWNATINGLSDHHACILFSILLPSVK